jgi:hypothetical protein
MKQITIVKMYARNVKIALLRKGSLFRCSNDGI